MIIDCISDLHGYYPVLDGGDLLIIAGDLIEQSKSHEILKFLLWLDKQDYKKKVFISGNHDILLQQMPITVSISPDNVFYLCDSGTEFDGLKIWGSPWTRSFYGQNPDCMAFTRRLETQLMEKFELIPSDTDILITHSPPHGILDNELGSTALRKIVLSRDRLPSLKLHAFGHIHEHGGKMLDTALTKFINCSIMDEAYDPVHNPVRVIL